MCGIAGFYEHQPGSAGDKQALLTSLLDPIRHRGPDDRGTYVGNFASVGINRLAIMDLTQGLYPFSSSSGNRLVLNGEIYNYQALKKELEQLGEVFITRCDAEVVLKGYDRWGTGVFSRLRGMFALAIIDEKQHSLVLARDRLGIKPLYYLENNGVTFFASEAKSFLSLPNSHFCPELDHQTISVLLGFMFLPNNEQTVIKGIKKLAPATYVTIKGNEKTFVKYWDLPEKDSLNDNRSEAELQQNLDEKLREVVGLHLQSDVPVGVLLSGGVDSSLISALTCKYNPKVSTFTACFNHKRDETVLATETARYLDTLHHNLAIDTKTVADRFSDYIDLFDDLSTFDGGVITMKLLCEEAKKAGNKVVLTGEGADELFGGYSWFGLNQPPLHYLPAVLRNAIYYYALSRNLTVNSLNYAALWNKINPKNNIYASELLTQLPNHLLMKVDKGSMAASVEARVPYLDHELVEQAYALKNRYKNQKYLLRKVAENHLPKTTAWRKKQGFMLPLKEVVQASLPRLSDQVFSANSLSRQLLPVKILQSFFVPSKVELLNMQNEYFLWRLLVLETWSQKYKLT